MKRYLPLITVLLIMAVFSPMSNRAAAAEIDRDADHLGDIGRELSQASLVRRNPVPVKRATQLHISVQKRTLAKMQQNDLLRELLASETVHHESTEVSNAVKKLHE